MIALKGETIIGLHYLKRLSQRLQSVKGHIKPDQLRIENLTLPTPVSLNISSTVSKKLSRKQLNPEACATYHKRNTPELCFLPV